MVIEWVGFFAAIAALLVLSRKDLSLALLAGSVVLGVFTIGPTETLESFARTLTTASEMLLALAMGLFPVLGMLLQKTGALDDLIENLRISKKLFLSFSAALIGLLPVPGGALLSAPLVKKASGSLSPERSFVINIWFRHVLILIYPIGPALLVPAKIANISVYEAIPYLFPFFLLLVALGYIFLLRDIQDDMTYERESQPRRLVMPLLIILLPPLLDITFNSLFTITPKELVTFCAVLASIVVATVWGRVSLPSLRAYTVQAKPWKFIAIIIGMFLFIGVFRESGMGSLIASLAVPAVVLSVVIAFLLAFVTGRTQLSASVVIPTYLGAAGLLSMPHGLFAITFVSIFLGYLISPLHPCISVSLEYFNTTLERAIRAMASQTIIALVIVFVLFLLVY